MKKLTTTLLVLALLGWWQSQTSKIELPPGVKAPNAPTQNSLKNIDQFNLNGYQVEPLASFDLEAKVLSKKRYRADRGADVSPFDLALGWGIMSDQTVVDSLTIRQSGRWYRYRSNTQTFPYPIDLLGKNSANMHMVPSNDYVQDQLGEIKVGSIAKFTGKLVSISHKDGFRWRSSLTREDQGDGACELFYVESIMVIQD